MMLTIKKKTDKIMISLRMIIKKYFFLLHTVEQLCSNSVIGILYSYALNWEI